jgi:hypothetical protein
MHARELNLGRKNAIFKDYVHPGIALQRMCTALGYGASVVTVGKLFQKN